MSEDHRRVAKAIIHVVLLQQSIPNDLQIRGGLGGRLSLHGGGSEQATATILPRTA